VVIFVAAFAGACSDVVAVATVQGSTRFREHGIVGEREHCCDDDWNGDDTSHRQEPIGAVAPTDDGTAATAGRRSHRRTE
jgi:hypothetical protein